VDPPAGVVVEGLAALRPPGVRAGAVAVAGAVDVHPSQLLGEPVQVGALLGQEAGGLQVALPVLDVPLGVGDVDVPGEDHVPSVGPERFEVLHHDVEELVLVGHRLRLLGVARVHVAGDDRHRGAVAERVLEVRLEPAAGVRVGREAGQPAAHALEVDPLQRGAGGDRDAGAALELRGLPHDGPFLAQQIGEQLLGGPHLRQGDDVGGRGGEPVAHPLAGGGPQAVDVDGGQGEGHAGSSIPAARSAASTSFFSSSARVIGPTPPGLGLSHPATSAAAGSTSPTRVALPPAGSSRRETPTSNTTAPGFTSSARTRCAAPAAATITSARRSWAGRSAVPVWHRVTVALYSRRVSSAPMERPTVMPRPTTTTSLPRKSRPWRSASSITARGVQGSGVWMGLLALSTRRPRFIGCSPSASLAGSIRSRIASVSICSGSGSCTM